MSTPVYLTYFVYKLRQLSLVSFPCSTAPPTAVVEVPASPTAVVEVPAPPTAVVEVQISAANTDENMTVIKLWVWISDPT